MFPIATSIGSVPLWIGFGLLIVAMLALDLGIFNRRAHKIGFRESIVWSVVWITLSLLFGGGIFGFLSAERGAEFVAAWLIEKALSVDNLFVFLVIFKTFKTPPEQQHRALFWGVVGAVIFRGAFIFGGTALLALFHPAVYILGGFLIFTGLKLAFTREEGEDEDSFVVKVFKKWIGDNPASFLVLIAIIEISDIIFALDSIPAVLAISNDPFIVVTSNIFAILGLRALFFLVAGALEEVRFLKFGLAVILTFVGAKMVGEHYFQVPIIASLAIIVSILGASVLASIYFPPPKEADEKAETAEAEKAPEPTAPKPAEPAAPKPDGSV